MLTSISWYAFYSQINVLYSKWIVFKITKAYMKQSQTKVQVHPDYVFFIYSYLYCLALNLMVDNALYTKHITIPLWVSSISINSLSLICSSSITLSFSLHTLFTASLNRVWNVSNNQTFKHIFKYISFCFVASCLNNNCYKSCWPVSNVYVK